MESAIRTSLEEIPRLGSSHSSAPSKSSSLFEGSETSTLTYGQEPWTAFQPRVEKLCETRWPEKKGLADDMRGSRLATWLQKRIWLAVRKPPRPTATVERLGGGDYNRITGITLRAKRNKGETRLILRTPREIGQGRLDRQIALLDFLGQRSTIPVAKVVGHDLTAINPLGSPYMVQGRLEGKDLDGRWNDLTHPQRCSVAIEVGKTVRQLLSMESAFTGILETANPVTIAPFVLECRWADVGVEQQHYSLQTGEHREPESTVDFFLKNLACWRAYELDPGSEVTFAVELLDDVIKMTQQMIELRLFDGIGHCLCHVDLEPRNIMASLRPDQSLEITGILDWDEAVFAPKFVNCKPPTWIWGEKGDVEDELELWPYETTRADPASLSAENRYLKDLFEENAGAEFVRLASLPQYRLCRGLYSLAREGLCDSEGYKLVVRLLREWEILRPTLGSDR